MNQPSFEKFEPTVKPNGTVIINSTLVQSRSKRKDINQLLIPVNEIATKTGNMKTANIVALAALVARSQIVTFDVLEKCLIERTQSTVQIIKMSSNFLCNRSEIGDYSIYYITYFIYCIMSHTSKI